MAMAQKEAAKANAQDDIFEKIKQLGVKSGDLILIKLKGEKAAELQSGKVCGDYILAVVNWIHYKDMRVQTMSHVWADDLKAEDIADVKVLNNWSVIVTSKDGTKVEGTAKGLVYPETLFGLMNVNIPYLSIETLDGKKKEVRVSKISNLEFKPATEAFPGN